MAATHGSVARLFANGYNLSGYMRDATFSATGDVAETTVWGLTSKTYIPGKTEGVISGEGIWDADMVTGNDRPDDVLGPALATEGVITYCPYGDVAGYKCRIADTAHTSYEIVSPGDDVTSFVFEAQSDAGGHAYGTILRASTGTLAINAAGNGSSIDDEYLQTPVATTFGGVGALHVVNKGGSAGSITVTLQSSVNGSTGWADFGTFSAASAARAKEVIYIASGVTINRYVRAAWTLTAGTTWDIQVAFARRYML